MTDMVPCPACHNPLTPVPQEHTKHCKFAVCGFCGTILSVDFAGLYSVASQHAIVHACTYNVDAYPTFAHLIAIASMERVRYGHV
jgi:hypothetical protein